MKNKYIFITFLTFLTCDIMGLLEIRSVKITDKGQISIPKELRQKAGFKKGDKIAILNFDDHRTSPNG